MDKGLANLKAALAGKSQANRPYPAGAASVPILRFQHP